MFGEIPVIITHVKLETETHLSQVTQAGNGLGFQFGTSQGGKKHTSQNGNDGDDDEQLNERKGTFTAMMGHFD